MTVSNGGITQVFTSPTCATVLETKKKTKIGANPSVCYVRRNIGDKGANSFIIFFNKLPAGATLVSATLTLTAASNWGPAFNMTVFELRERWGAANVTWAKQPGSTGTSTTKNVPANITKGTKVDFNVTPQYASYLTNPKSYGMKIYTGSPNNTTYRNFYGSGTNRPKLTVVYTMPIDKPIDLSPGSSDYDRPVATSAPKPTYSATFDANTTTAIVNQTQVQVTTNFTGNVPNFSSPLWDSGWVTTTEPELDSSTISGSPSIEVGTRYGWRIRFKSNQGIESPWSDGVVLEREVMPSVLINKAGLTAEFGNLATNPSFETVADTSTASDILLMTNGATNPSFELTYNSDISVPGGGMAKDVLRQKGGGPVTGIGGAVVYRDTLNHAATEARWPFKGTYSMCVDATSASANTSSALLGGAATGNPALWNVSSGGTYTVSAYFYQDTLQTGTLNTFARSIKVNITAPSVNGGAPMAGWKVAQAQNMVGIQRVSVTFTLPASTSAFNIELTNGATSGKVWWDGFMIDNNKKLNSWFDKSTVMSSNGVGGDGYPDYRVADLGTSGAGVYVKKVMRFGGGGPISGDNGDVYRTTAHPSMSSKFALAVDPRGSSGTNVNAFLGGAGDSGSLSRLGIVPGNEYTISVDLYVPEVQTGPLSSRARSIGVLCTRPGGDTFIQSEQGAVVGLSRVSLTATIPSDTTAITVGLYNGSSGYNPDTGLGGQIVLWDNVRITKSPTSEYADGGYLGYTWSGAEQGSTTTVDAIVYNSTPEFSWVVAGGVQAYREAIILDLSRPDDDNIIWTSGRQDTDDLEIGIPAKVIKEVGKPYRFVIRVEDDANRQPTYASGVYYPEYVEDFIDFIYMLDNDTYGVDNLTTNMKGPIDVELSWSVNDEPDFFEISRDGVIIATNIIPEDFKVGDRQYKCIDLEAKTNLVNTWEVRNIVDGRTSANNKQSSRKVLTTLLWLQPNLGSSLPSGIEVSSGAAISETVLAPYSTSTPHNKLVPIAGESPADFDLYEKGATFEPLNSSNPVRITEALGGYRGKVNGVLCGECLGDGTTSQDLQDIMLKVRENVGNKHILKIDNITIPVIVYNVNTFPMYGARFGKSYGITFEFFEVVESV